MGYELTFHYHEQVDKGEYNKEETKTKVVKIGSPYDEIPLEAVASRIMAQLARRNILIVDVEIYEYTKKKLSFKETSDGILIKNKKFSFDDGVGLTAVDVPCEESQPLPSNPQVDQQQLLQQLLASLLAGNQSVISSLMPNQSKQLGVNLAPTSPASVGSSKNSVLRHEIFNPLEKEMIIDCQKRGMRFTLGNKYPIINERMAPNKLAGMMYTTIDDVGQRQILSDKFFTPEVSNLEFGEIFEEEFVPNAMKKKGGGDGLDWSGFVDEGEEQINIR